MQWIARASAIPTAAAIVRLPHGLFCSLVVILVVFRGTKDDLAQALADLSELIRSPDGLVELRRLIDEGTPLLRANIDRLSAAEAGDLIARYDVCEPLKVFPWPQCGHGTGKRMKSKADIVVLPCGGKSALMPRLSSRPRMCQMISLMFDSSIEHEAVRYPMA
jgi:hypothetical protein